MTWNGSSVTTIRFLSERLVSSMSVLARTMIWPLPVDAAFLIPSCPMIVPPVGKSGPLTMRMRLSTVSAGSSMRRMMALHTSVGL